MTVQTATGSVDSSELGGTLVHEHVFIADPGLDRRTLSVIAFGALRLSLRADPKRGIIAGVFPDVYGAGHGWRSSDVTETT